MGLRYPFGLLGLLAVLFFSVVLCRAAAIPGAKANLTAPTLTRTASTVVLLWDRFSDKDNEYQILRDDTVIGRTKTLSFTVTQLEAGERGRFRVRAVNARGQPVSESEQIETQSLPLGPVLNVRDLGARGDGQTQDTAAIQASIQACPPGGTVVIPPGEYVVSQIRLKSDLTLDIKRGATLRFLGRGESEYPTESLEVSGPDGDVPLRCGALIMGVRTNNVTITGGGTILGNGATWWPHPTSYRPKAIQIVAARNVFIQGITVEDPPFWNTHLVYIDDLAVSNVTFLKRSTVKGSNGDGLDPDSCRNVLIVGCAFGNQDDSIAIKSGSAAKGTRKRQRSCENIVVRDCRFDGRLAPGSHPLGFAIGSGSSGGVRNVRVHDCEFVDVASLANLKSNHENYYGVYEDIRIENCTYTNTLFPDEPWNRAPISLDLFYYDRSGGPDAKRELTPATPIFRNIHFRNITIDNVLGRAIFITGFSERPIENVSFTDVTAKTKNGFYAANIDQLSLTRVTITAAEGDSFQWGKNVTNRRGGPEYAAP
jgi:polygalacturonase